MKNQREFKLDTSAMRSSARLIASAAMCAALYAIVNIVTSPIRAPWGVGEFRPGVVIPAFFAVVDGPLPAGIGAGVGSFIGDMISLVATGGSNPTLAVVAGAPANFLGFLILGWIFQKFKTWKGFALGSAVGLLVGNLWAAAGVVLILGLPNILILGYLMFWFGTMFPFVIVFVPPLVKYMAPYSSRLTRGTKYPKFAEPARKVVWIWTGVVTVLVLVCLGIFLLASNQLAASNFGNPTWIEILLAASAVSVIAVAAFIPISDSNQNRSLESTQKQTQ